MDGEPATVREEKIQHEIEVSRRRMAADIDEMARFLNGRALLRRALRRAAVPAAVIAGGAVAWVVFRRS
jgi:hypothetical protein